MRDTYRMSFEGKRKGEEKGETATASFGRRQTGK